MQHKGLRRFGLLYAEQLHNSDKSREPLLCLRTQKSPAQARLRCCAAVQLLCNDAVR